MRQESVDYNVITTKNWTRCILLILLILTSSLTCACASSSSATYQKISQTEAYEIMQKQRGYIIIDVRTPEEYLEGHIKNAKLLPLQNIPQDIDIVLKDRNQLILVYCRSGNRSKQAASKLVEAGFKNVKDFGGIIEWKYDVEKEH